MILLQRIFWVFCCANEIRLPAFKFYPKLFFESQHDKTNTIIFRPQQRLRSTCSPAQSDQSSQCAHCVAKDLTFFHAHRRRFRSDWANALADLKLRWAHRDILLGFGSFVTKIVSCRNVKEIEKYRRMKRKKERKKKESKRKKEANKKKEMKKERKKERKERKKETKKERKKQTNKQTNKEWPRIFIDSKKRKTGNVCHRVNW